MDNVKKGLIFVGVVAGTVALGLAMSGRAGASPPTGEYTCKVCGEEFSTIEEYQAHVRDLRDIIGDPHYGMATPIEIIWG